MRGAIDLSARVEALKSVGLGLADQRFKDGLVKIFAKAEARLLTAPWADSVTPCSMIPTPARRAMPAPL
jgi:hypothetical protein